MALLTSVFASHYSAPRLQARLNSFRATIAHGRSPSSIQSRPEIKKQKLRTRNLNSSRETNNAEDLLTQRERF